MPKSKQQPVKIKYVKKAAKLVPVEKPEPPTDNETKLLAAIISIFDNWDAEQRSRNLKYLASKYYDFL